MKESTIRPQNKALEGWCLINIATTKEDLSTSSSMAKANMVFKIPKPKNGPFMKVNGKMGN